MKKTIVMMVVLVMSLVGSTSWAHTHSGGTDKRVSPLNPVSFEISM